MEKNVPGEGHLLVQPLLLLLLLLLLLQLLLLLLLLLLLISTNTLLQTVPRLLPFLSIEISGSWRGKCTDVGARCYCVHSVDGRVV